MHPADANLIVSMLDLHISPSNSAGPPLLEILEAGTGHGALTLYLARAIHAANVEAVRFYNPHNLEKNDQEISSNPQKSHKQTGEKIWQKKIKANHNVQSCYVHGQDTRRAVVHTVDILPKHSEGARQTVQGFRRGLYRHNIEFHVGDVSDWIGEQISIRNLNPRESFLSHVILDMPNNHRPVEKAASALHVNGNLLAFHTNIARVISVVGFIERQNLPLRLHRVLEIGSLMTGGRRWEVKVKKPTQISDTEDQSDSDFWGHYAGEDSELELEDNGGPSAVDQKEKSRHETSQTLHGTAGNRRIICRPRPGDHTIGGGFLGVWKKMKL
ncbi:hypothetical protein ACLMJK_006867 [Lecanora helva]